MSKHIDHTGEKNTNNDGLEMIITNCPNTHNMTVLFPSSGYSRSGVYYADFQSGKVKDKLNPKLIISNRLGDRRQMSNGLWAQISKYRSPNNITVTYDNGYKTITTYDKFVSGQVDAGTKRHVVLTGRTYIDNHDNIYCVSEDKGSTLMVRYNDGQIKQISRAHHLKTAATYPRREGNNRKIVQGYIIHSKSGEDYKVVKVYPSVTKKGSRYVDVEGPYGFEQHIQAYSLVQRKYTKIERDILLAQARAKAIKKHNDNIMKDLIGQTSTSAEGHQLKIIGGNNKSDITIQIEGGEVIDHCTYYHFVHNMIKLSSRKEAIIAKNKKKLLGMRVLQKNGLTATLTDYRGYNDVTVCFEDGETITTSLYRFRHGLCANKMLRAASTGSLNEFTIFYVLSRYGFDKKHISDNSIPALTGKELDMYNPTLHLAIEYDGFLHKDTISKDIEKDKLCQDAGINIIRIREPGIPLLQDDIAKEIPLADGHYFSPALRSAITTIATILKDDYSLVIELPDLSDIEMKTKIIKDYAKRNRYAKHVGEVNINKDGYIMTIKKYHGCLDVDVEFDNGYIAYHRSMTAFRTGDIKREETHMHEKNTSRGGEEMTIISNDFGQKVDVQFEDGTIVRNKNYCDFVRGNIANPNLQTNKDQALIGKKIKANCGKIAEIIDVNRVRVKNQSILYVIARFEDGALSKPTEYQHYLKGNIKHPKIKMFNENWYAKQSARGLRKKENCARTIMKSTYTSKDGHIYKVINYYDSNHIRIRFDEDGYELNTSMGVIKANQILRYLPENRRRNTVPFEEWLHNKQGAYKARD